MPVVAIYYLFNIVLVSLSVKASVCVLNLNFRGANKEEIKVPRWLKRMLFIKEKPNVKMSKDKKVKENSIVMLKKGNNYVSLNKSVFGDLMSRKPSLGIINGNLYFVLTFIKASGYF
jgi:hypothetical protein